MDNIESINNSRLILQIKKSIEEILYGYIFEAPDDITINSMKARIHQFSDALKSQGYIYDYNVLSFLTGDDVDNNRFPYFNISIQISPSAEYVNLQCTIVPPEQYNNISKSKQKKLQIELDDKLFQI